MVSGAGSAAVAGGVVVRIDALCCLLRPSDALARLFDRPSSRCSHQSAANRAGGIMPRAECGRCWL